MRLKQPVTAIGVVLTLLACPGCRSAQPSAAQTKPDVASARPIVVQNGEQSKSEPNTTPPTITFETTTHDLGEIGFGVTNTCEFRFTNTGRADLKITGIKKTCGCTVAELARQDYAPGEPGFVGSPRVQQVAHPTFWIPAFAGMTCSCFVG